MSKSTTRTVINPFKPLINKLPKGLRNRYYVVLIIFGVFMLVFDKSNVWAQIKLQRAIRRLETDKAFYQKKLEEVQHQKVDMENNKEKFAREHYFMKSPDEDVFVIEDKTTK